jgi:N-glycosylase/DNA lyase
MTNKQRNDLMPKSKSSLDCVAELCRPTCRQVVVVSFFLPRLKDRMLLTTTINACHLIFPRYLITMALAIKSTVQIASPCSSSYCDDRVPPSSTIIPSQREKRRRTRTSCSSIAASLSSPIPSRCLSFSSIPIVTPPSSVVRRFHTNLQSHETDLSIIVDPNPSSCEMIPPPLVRSDAVIPTSKSRSKSLTLPFHLTSEQVAKVGTDIFHDLGLSPTEFRPSVTLTTGQCFHWHEVLDLTTEIKNNTLNNMTEDNKHLIQSPKSKSAWGSHNATEWVGVLRDRERGGSVIVVLRETPETTLFRVLHSSGMDASDTSCIRQMLRSYFQSNVPLATHYKLWSQQCHRLAVIAQYIVGVRLVTQDPWECLVSFICSTNNNIPRITKMLHAIRKQYGSLLLQIDGENDNDNDITSFYAFPSLEIMRIHATEVELREKCGLGYRAKYLMDTIVMLHDELDGESYLHELRNESDPLIVQQKLMQFAGVGRKVADCVALFSLCQHDAIPVDVHVWNIVRRDYDPHGLLHEVKSITPTVYQQVGNLFRERFISKAGWAHSLLFVAELPSFRPKLPDAIVSDMTQVYFVLVLTMTKSCICLLFHFGIVAKVVLLLSVFSSWTSFEKPRKNERFFKGISGRKQGKKNNPSWLWIKTVVAC